MKTTIHTPIIRELIRLGINRTNAYRMVARPKKTSAASRLLVRIIRYLLDNGIRLPEDV